MTDKAVLAVMAGLVAPAIRAAPFNDRGPLAPLDGVDARDKPGHDDAGRENEKPAQ